MHRRSVRCAVAMLAMALPATMGSAAGEVGEHFRFGLEVKGHFRSSDDVILPTAFGNPVVPDEVIMLTSVDPGDHFEVSVVTAVLEAVWGRQDRFSIRAKLDAIDRYDRNPTSTDSDFDVDELWFRVGHEREPGDPGLDPGVFLKVGKIPSFERQDDRHLESYGLISTAFNRMEDLGVEFGWRVGQHFYGRLSATQGNPLFFRDPTALAGDNGTDAAFDPAGPPLGTGLAILYDFETERFDLEGRDPEIGVGLGWRFGDDTGVRALDVMVWGRRRDLDESASIHGSFYGGDLDILFGPLNDFRFDVVDDEKREIGANLWFYQGGFALFAQYVDQDLGGLGRTGYEVEASWRFELPLIGAVFGRQLFPTIAPSVRYSKLDPEFEFPRPTPSPSFAWDWEKIDIGVRLEIVEGLDLTAEYAINEFIRAGKAVNNDEGLLTLRWRFGEV